MKIKVALLEKDKSYLDRFISAFNAKFADKIELYSFTDKNIAIESLEDNRIDVFVAGESFEIDVNDIPSKCVFAYFVDTPGIDSFSGQSAICKYQKADLIYKQFLSLYSEKAGGISSLKLDDDSTKVIMFSSPVGGVGASSVAAACAKHFAKNGLNSLYLNIEPFGAAEMFFSGEGLYDMGDVIYALKSKKTNLSMKLESCVRKDPSGVNFFASSKMALDMLELKAEDIVRLIDELKLSGSYNYIIIDAGFGLDKEYQQLYKTAHSVIWISDGEEISNSKIRKAFEAVTVLEKGNKFELTNRLNLIYNRFSSKSGTYLDDVDIKMAGGVPVYVHNDATQVVDQISNMGMFDNII